MLIDNYFKINEFKESNSDFVFNISLMPQHRIYEGHFPGNPVSPGVCSIQMMRECIEKITGKSMIIVSIGLCRFVNVLTPDKGQNLLLKISPVIEGPSVKASVVLSNNTESVVFVSFKGEFIEK